jgi:type IV pilus assembly protein PilB
MTAQTQPTRPRLGDYLVGAGIISPTQLDQALREQSSWGGRLGQNLLTLGFIDERRLAAAIAKHLGLPAVDLDRATLPADVTRLLPLEIAERYGLMPLGARPREGRILIACFDPTDTGAISAAARSSGLVPDVHVATATSIDRAIRRYYYGEVSTGAATRDPRFTVTRNTMEPDRPPETEVDLASRVAGLEVRVERLTRALAELGARVPVE